MTQYGSLGVDIERRVAARSFDKGIGDAAVPFDRELDDDCAADFACCTQATSDAIDHQRHLSGQQKSATSSVDPAPGPPPVDSPNPMPLAPVSATALPGRTSAPRVGAPLRGSSSPFLAGSAFSGLAPGFGIVISGVFAAGGRTASRFGVSSGGAYSAPGARRSMSSRRFAVLHRHRRV